MMRDMKTIGPQRDWKQYSNAQGEYWHPVFWAPAENYPTLEADPEWFMRRLEEFNLETETRYLGEGMPVSYETGLLKRYESGDKTAIRDWVPQVGPQPVDGQPLFTLHGWFVLTLQDSDVGPFVTWVRVRQEQGGSTGDSHG